MAYIPAVPSTVVTVTVSGVVSVIPVPGRSRVTVTVKGTPSITDVGAADKVTVPASTFKKMREYYISAYTNM